MTYAEYSEPEEQSEGFLLFLLLAVSFLLIIGALAIIYFIDALG